jgi:hypothetical protein
VESTNNIGIDALSYNVAGTGLLSITSQGVTGGSFGIFARNFGTGALTIANGDVAGTNSIGIYAQSYGVDAYGTSLSIVSQGVTGGGTGIFAEALAPEP